MQSPPDAPAGFLHSGDVLLGEGVEVVEAVRPVCCAMRAFTTEVKLTQPFAALSEVFGRAALVSATAAGPRLGGLQALHALTEIMKFGLDFGGHLSISAMLGRR
jgi:hypothetical protein